MSTWPKWRVVYNLTSRFWRVDAHSACTSTKPSTDQLADMGFLALQPQLTTALVVAIAVNNMVVHFTLQEAFGVDLEQLDDAHVRPSRDSP